MLRICNPLHNIPNFAPQQYPILSYLSVQNHKFPVLNQVIPVQNRVSFVRNPIIPVQNPIIPVQNPIISVQNPVVSVRNPVIPVQNPVVPVRNRVSFVLNRDCIKNPCTRQGLMVRNCFCYSTTGFSVGGFLLPRETKNCFSSFILFSKPAAPEPARYVVYP